jgi:hypothetical protein
MAGNEQRPTDDVQGHSRRSPSQDTEAIDQDRGTSNPDDTEGHAWRGWQDTEAVEDDRGSRLPDDVEGHAYKWVQDTEAVDEDQAGRDDTEGHIKY